MKFALITEGPSEHKIIKYIVTKFFKDKDPEINQIQPKIINGKQENTGGWNEVLKYCERQELKDIFVENDFLIIQIDTDQSQTRPFNVSHSKTDNNLKTVDELYTDVIEKLKGLIKPEILEVYNEKIFFAICIHTIECWLLPMYFSNSHKSDTKNCLSSLNKELRRQDIHMIPAKNKNSANSVRTYEAVLKNWKRKQDIINTSFHNAAFKKFIETLSVLEEIE